MHDPRLVISLRPQPPQAAPPPASAATESPKPPKEKKKLTVRVTRIALYAATAAFVIVFGTGAGVMLFRWWSNNGVSATGKQGSDGTTITAATAAGGTNSTSDVIAKVSRLIELPQDEVPTVAAVTDPAKLGNQAFFFHAKAGDQVLVYTKARKAILYDPRTDKIVEVAPIAVDPLK